MRPIDADELKQYEITMPRGDGYSVFVFAGHIHKAPTIDAVPVVRCKDCRHYRTNNTAGFPHCEILKRFVTKDWFCAYGERR